MSNLHGISVREGRRGEYVRALGPASSDHLFGLLGRLRGRKQEKSGESVWAIGRNRPHATEKGQPFFVLCDDDRQTGEVTLRLLSSTRSALYYKCSVFDATVIKRVVIKPCAAAEDVAEIALRLQAEAEELEMQSHLDATEQQVVDGPASDHLLVARAALKP